MSSLASGLDKRALDKEWLRELRCGNQYLPPRSFRLDGSVQLPGNGQARMQRSYKYLGHRESTEHGSESLLETG